MGVPYVPVIGLVGTDLLARRDDMVLAPDPFGAGKVTVVANGAGDVISIKIAKEVIDPEDVEFLEDLILTAVQKAIEEGKEMAQAEMGKLTGGMGLPPGMGF